jgi:hypothetical protein
LAQLNLGNQDTLGELSTIGTDITKRKRRGTTSDNNDRPAKKVELVPKGPASNTRHGAAKASGGPKPTGGKPTNLVSIPHH